MYSWTNVAARTVKVYDRVSSAAWDDSMLGRLRRFGACGPWAGRLFSAVVVCEHLYWRFLEWWQPACGVDAAQDWPQAGGAGAYERSDSVRGG